MVVILMFNVWELNVMVVKLLLLVVLLCVNGVFKFILVIMLVGVKMIFFLF